MRASPSASFALAKALCNYGWALDRKATVTGSARERRPALVLRLLTCRRSARVGLRDDTVPRRRTEGLGPFHDPIETMAYYTYKLASEGATYTSRSNAPKNSRCSAPAAHHRARGASRWREHEVRGARACRWSKQVTCLDGSRQLK